MTSAEKVEVGLIPLVGMAVWLTAPNLPSHVSISSLLLGSSVLLLFQGLLRDLWLISIQNRHTQNEPPQQALCMCVESTIGVTGVAAGLILLGSGASDLQLSIASGMWSGLSVAMLVTGFWIKDFVFEWRPFRVRRDKDHLNIVFSWKR